MIKLRVKGYKLDSICKLVGISRQAYYKRKHKQHSQAKLYQIAEQIVHHERQRRSRAGLRVIYHKNNLFDLLGINRFEQEMSARGHALKPYKSYIKTTDSRGHYNKFENLIAGQLINGENQILVGDITYYQNRGVLYYIFHFTDVYTHEVKGLLGSKNMEGIMAEKCLRQVFNYNGIRKYKHKMIIHTDQGGQYRSHKFLQMLSAAQIKPSHAQNCLENGLAERENGILKNEYLVDYDIKNVNELNRVLRKIKNQINQDWPSPILGYKTPRQFAQENRLKKLANRPVKKIKIVE